MRRILPLSLLLLAWAGTALAEQQACSLDIATCLKMYDRMRERPWFGITFENDSTGKVLVAGVTANSPAERGGIRPGDMIQTIDGRQPKEWFMAKAGWKPKDKGKVHVLRDQKQVALEMPYEAIPEDVFARIVGVHMIEGHLAYMDEHKH